MSFTESALKLFHLGEGPPDQSKRFAAVGRDLPRVDGRAKVTGTATYAAEWPLNELLHGAVVDSAIARGTIRSIDDTAALAAPGVLAVVTHENAPRLSSYPKKGAGFPLTGEGGLGEVRQPLQEPAIYYGAQSIAVVVAETSEQARFAATLVKVEYDAQTPELDMHAASWTTKPEEFSGGEALQRGDKSVENALQGAPVRFEREYENPVYHHNPIEILASIAQWEQHNDKDHLLLYDTTRSVDMLRDVVCHSFGLPLDPVHIVSKFIGGAFGSKAWTYHNPLLVALAAKVVGRPLRLEWRRQQVWSIGGHRPAQRHRLRIGAEPDGRMRALHHWTRQHSSMISGYTEYGSRMTKMMYAVPELGFTNELAHLNGDTNFPQAPPTHGSLTTATVGPAVLDAATDVLSKLKKLASKDKASPLHGVNAEQIEATAGRLHARGDLAIGEDYGAILRSAGLQEVTGKADVKPGPERMRYSFYSFGAVFAEVRVDSETGVVRVTRLSGVYDCGRMINPRTARSQLMGGMIFGLGAALTEETIFDPVNGLPVTRNLADYHVPSCADTPEITIEVLNIPDPHIGALGAHGVGEMGTNGVPPAIGNAIYNATGQRLRALPYTPDKLIEAYRHE